MCSRVSIGAIQSLAIKWTSFLFTASFSGLVAFMFVGSTAPGHWVAFPMIALLPTFTYFQTLNTANVYVEGTDFLIEHAVKGVIRKDFALYRSVESSLFLPHSIVFSDGTSYYFYPSVTGMWQAFIKDSQGYSNYVRSLISAQVPAADASTERP